MKNENLKKLLALFLALVMCFSLLPVSAFAEGEGGDEDEAVLEQTEDESPAPEEEEEPPAPTEDVQEPEPVPVQEPDPAPEPEPEPVHEPEPEPEADDPIQQNHLLGAEGGTGDRATSGNCGENLTWELNNGTLTITGTGGTFTFYPTDRRRPPWYGFCGEIEAISIGSGVTDIGNYCFDDCSNLSSLSIGQPSSLTRIGKNAFSDCSKLTSALIPEGVTLIDKYAFQRSGLQSVTLPTTLVRIGEYAFGQSALQSVSIPEGVTSIGSYAFSNCTALQSVSIPSTLTLTGPEEDEEGQRCEYGEHYFAQCSNLEYVTIAPGLEEIGQRMFDACTALQSVTLPEGLKAIYIGAFGDCTSLKSVELPSSLQVVYKNAFQNTSLESVTFGGTRARWNKLLSDGRDEYAPGGIVPTGNVPLTSLTPTFMAFTVSYNAKGGSGAPAQQIKKRGVDLSLSGTKPVRQGYGFLGWAASADAAEAEYQPGQAYTAEADVTLYAVWRKICTVTYDANGGEGASEPQSVMEGVAFNLPNDEPALEGHVFLGWAVDKNALTAQYGPGDEFTTEADVTLYAVWQLKTYTVSYDASGGEGAPADQVKQHFQPLPLSEVVPTREGHAFLGWAAAPGAAEPEYQPGDEYETEADLQLYAVWLEGAETPADISLDHDYLLLIADREGAAVKILGLDTRLGNYVKWRTEMAEETAVGISLAMNGSTVTIRAISTDTGPATGTVWLVATIPGTGVKLRCRVDVVESEMALAAQLTGVRLVDTKATVELYQEDYTCVRILPELTQNNQTASAGQRSDGAVNAGFAIREASFVDTSDVAPGINDLFTLRVADDRTLEIIPTEVALGLGIAKSNTLKRSYKAAIAVTIYGASEPYVTAPLTLTVKKTVPKVTAKAVKLNSFLAADTQELQFTGGVPNSIAVTSPLGSLSDWLDVDTDGQTTLTYTGERSAKLSGKLKLTVKIPGWNVDIPVTVSVSAAPTKPKLTFKPSAVNLQPAGPSSVSTSAAITPAVFADCEITKVSVTESGRAADDALNVSISGQAITVSPTGAVTDGKAHTYKVTLGVHYNGETASTAVLTVKLAAAKPMTLTAKAAGTINTALPRSEAVITLTVKNADPRAVSIRSVAVWKQKAATKTTPEVKEDVTPSFEQRSDEDRLLVTLILTDSSMLEPGYTYTAELSLDDADHQPLSQTVTAKLTIKFSDPAKTKASVTLKAAGGIDVLRPGSTVTLTPTVKNCYTFVPNPEDLHIVKTYDGAEKQKRSDPTDDQFAVTVENGKYVVTGTSGLSHLDKYQVSMSFRYWDANGEEQICSSKAVALTVKMGAVKFSQSAKTVTLMKTDRFSSAPVTLTLSDAALAGINWQKTVDSFNASNTLYSLQYLGGNTVAICYRNNVITKAGTAKIALFLIGNKSAKANATASVGIKLV